MFIYVSIYIYIYVYIYIYIYNIIYYNIYIYILCQLRVAHDPLLLCLRQIPILTAKIHPTIPWISTTNRKKKTSFSNGGFLSHGGTPKSSIFSWGFSMINHPAIGVTPFMETPFHIFHDGHTFEL